LDFDETFIPIARFDSIHMLLAYATHHGFKFYQMDVKSTFLNDPIKEEVYVEKPPSFESEEYPNHVYKLHNALYGLNQAPRAWYECLRDFLIKMILGLVRPTLLSSLEKWEKICLYAKYILMILSLVVLTNPFCEEFSKIMTHMFEMSMMGVITFFLRFQIKQAKEGTLISQISIHMTYSRSLAWTR
jgi:hypothetical protein